MLRWLAALSLIALPQLGSAETAPSAKDVEFFENRIRPILAQECYECHRTGGKKKAGLALDHRAAMRKGGDRGAAIVPGDPAKSLLIQAIRHEHDKLMMPKAGAKLDDDIIEDFEKWIASGAADPRDSPPTEESVAADSQWESVLERRKRWWSFLPLENPSVPGKKGAHPIDRFIGERLATEQLPQAPAADRATLIRRLSFVLRGLPPTPEEIAAFVENDASDAYEQLVDTFLDSPRFGERWARHWMDWVRYADSHGSEGDPMIPYAYQYRDYLIRALNTDVPYDRLVKEHLAGDLLEEPRVNEALGLNESAIGPAHLRMVFHGFAPTDALAEQVRFTDDQINVVSKAFMGLTVSCARCHNHKFDPISQTDFYAWYGIFASSPPVSISAAAPPTPDHIRARNELQSLKTDIRGSLAADWAKALPGLKQRLEGMNEQISKAKDPNHLLHPFWLKNEGKSIGSTWSNSPKEATPHKVWNFTKKTDIQPWTVDGETISDSSDTGNFAISHEGSNALNGIYPAGRYSHAISTKDRGILISPRTLLEGEFDMWLQVAGDGGAVVRYAVQNYPRNGTVYPVRNLSGGNWRWEKFPLDYWNGDHIHAELTTAADQAILARQEDRSWIGVRQIMLMKKGQEPNRRPFEFAEPLQASLGQKSLVGAYRQTLAKAIDAWKSETVSDAQALFLDRALKDGLLPNALEELPGTRPLVERYLELEATLPAPTRVPGVLDRSDPFDQALLHRGDHKQPGDPVAHRFLDAIDSTPYSGESSRARLAQDLFRPDNPLSRRVAVNRFWHHAFGEGLVRTPDNLGRLGQKPSHPELLDHLAVWFEQNDYSIKSLLRYLVTSETWKASSSPSERAAENDPDNNLLSHAHLRRLDAEAIRDSLLAVSGRLEEGGSGPSVDGRQNKRSVFVRVKRNNLDRFLGTFDAPVPASTTGRRDVTNVPGQSLTLLNDPFILDQAQAWAARLEGKAPEAKVSSMFMTALGRQPTDSAVTSALFYVKASTKEHAIQTDARRKLEQKMATQSTAISDLEAKASARVRAERGQDPAAESDDDLLRPLAHWDFETDLKDQIGSLHGKAHGSARLDQGALVLDGGGHVATSHLVKDLSSKTLVARVKLDTLEQAGGGAISVQDNGGGHFDSIVFAERQKHRWMAGSEGFQRSQDFQAPKEGAAHKDFVHVAIVYEKDGQIRGYRQGEPYGSPYKSNGPHRFRAGKSEVLFGNRHGEPVKGRLLRGRIEDAALYERALSADEVAAIAAGDGNYVSARDRLAAMSKDEQRQHQEALTKRSTLQAELDALNAQPRAPSGWADLAHAIFNLKEFIYLR